METVLEEVKDEGGWRYLMCLLHLPLSNAYHICQPQEGVTHVYKLRLNFQREKDIQDSFLLYCKMLCSYLEWIQCNYNKRNGGNNNNNNKTHTHICICLICVCIFLISDILFMSESEVTYGRDLNICIQN